MKRCSNEHLFLYLQDSSHCILDEQYLHFLWRSKRIPFHQLSLSNGNSFQLISEGKYNAFESGPDFSCAQIKLDGIHWVGNVEVHVRSSDWYAHGHHRDPAYNNVILHVVLFHDREIVVNGMTIPTLELKSVIDFDHLQKHKIRANSALPCTGLIQTHRNLPFFDLVQPTLKTRLKRKSISAFSSSSDIMQHFYSLIARSFGSKVNDLPFEVLANQIPWRVLVNLDSNERFVAILSASGLYPRISLEIYANESVPIDTYWWKRKGQFAASQPEKRLAQFAAFVSFLPNDLSFVDLSAKEIVKYVSDLLQQSFIQFGLSHHIKKSFILNNLLINAIAPLLVHFNRVTTASAIIQSLDSENNYITRQFRAMGVNARHAGESQMLIEVYTQLCTAKKCLNCAVGIHLLNP